MPAYKERPIFDGRVYANVSCSGVTGSMLDGWARSWYTSITSAWTAQSGFSISLSSDCYQEATVKWFTWNWTFEYNFSYTVKSNTTGEVVSGNSIYTLSPLMVNGYRLACGSRNASIRVYGRFWLSGNYIYQVIPDTTVFSYRYQCMLERLFVTDQNDNELSGFSVSASGFYKYDTNQQFGLKDSDDVTFSGKIDVSYNDTKVLSVPYSVNIPIYSNGLMGGPRVEYRNILLASSN